MSNNKLSKEMIENIKNYKNKIQKIENFVDAVRQMPGMYIGSKGNKGFLNMIREIYQNSSDERERDDSPCTWISVIYDERNHITTIEDNGRGIPFELIIDIFTSEHMSSNYTKNEGEFTSGLHGVGSKVTNALSEWFEVESNQLGKSVRVKFIDGKPSEEGIVSIPNNGKQGTKISFRPSYEIMEDITLSAEEVLGLITLLLPLSKLDTEVYFKGILKNGKELNRHFKNTDGIISNLIMKTTSPIISPIIVNKYTGTKTIDLAFTYDSDDLMVESITSFANFCPTIDGTHKDGFVEGLCKFFRNYMNKIFLASNKKNKLTIINSDIKTGLKAIIAAKHLHPLFSGQAKEILTNTDMKAFVEEAVVESLELWAKNNPKDLQKLCRYYKDIAEIRVKSEEGKIKLSSKYESSTFTGLPKKFKEPQGKTDLEFVITEGKSAFGSACNSRCKLRQGLYPIRGKMPNAFSTNRDKFLSNEEVSSILTIIGGGYGRRFDLSKVKWSKIIFMTDADVDGYHIRQLLLKMLLLYAPDLIKDGRVYSAIPPLYSIESKKKDIYLTDRMAYVDYVQKSFIKSNTIQTDRGKALSKSELSKVLFDNIDYTYELEGLANKYALNYELLETVLLNIDLGKDKLKTFIENKYRFLSVNEVNGSIVIKGLLNKQYETFIINDSFLNECKSIFEYFKSNDYLYFNMNGEIVSLYKLMKAFEAYAPSHLQRYKGLGEMDSKQLKNSTLHPDSDRTLIQYTLESATKEIEMIRYYESNKQELIKNVKTSRLDILG